MHTVHSIRKRSTVKGGSTNTGLWLHLFATPGGCEKRGRSGVIQGDPTYGLLRKHTETARQATKQSKGVPENRYASTGGMLEQVERKQ